MRFAVFVLIVIVASAYGAPEPHKLGFGVPALAVAEPIVPVPLVVPKVVPVVQPIIQPAYYPVVQPAYYPVVPVVGRFG